MTGLLLACTLFAGPVTSLPAVDLTGRPLDLLQAAGGKATVVVFLSFDCPVSNSYVAVLNALSRDAAGRGVKLVGVVPGDEPLDAVRKHAAGFELAFPLVADPNLTAADALKVTTVPSAVVLDATRQVRYRGRIDDGFAARLKPKPVTSHDLTAALDAVLDGRPVAAPETAAIGCPIPRAAQSAAAAGPTFHKDVEPILQKNCQGCHRPGQVGPFSLLTYKQATRWADDIVTYTADRRMPPWKPQAGPPGGFSNQRGLTDAEKATLAKWVESSCPEGDATDAPLPASYSDDWQNGPPDLVLTVNEDFRVGPTGPDVFRAFVLPTGLADDRHIVGYEVKPGNPKVVHHTLNFWDLSGRARQLEAKAKATEKAGPDGGPGYPSPMSIGFIPLPDPKRPGQPTAGGFGGWAPGQLATKLPAGAAFHLPGGADVVIQTHYHRTGKPETDRLRIGLYFAKGPVEKVWQTLAVGGLSPLVRIPAGKADYEGRGAVWLKHDATIHSLVPHMHLIGRSIRMTLTPPSGEAVTLIDIPEWDYNWQETYWLKKPIVAPAGSKLEVAAMYDNSDKNPHNPSRPPRAVYFGEETTSEMLFGFVGVTPVGSERVRVSRIDPAKVEKP